MGCCVSTEENKATQQQQQQQQQPNQQFPCISKSPPRPEEESVKEVLSETRKPVPEPEPGFKPITKKSQDPEPEVEKLLQVPTKADIFLSPKKPTVREKQQVPINGPKYPDGPGRVCTTPEEVSETSEICSVSETLSTSTIKEREEQEEVIQQRVVSKIQGHNGHFRNRAYSSGRSPARRRSDPSPPRRRGAGSGQCGPPGRSRSPAGSNVGRSMSGRRTVPSPGRVRMVQQHPKDPDEVKEEKSDEKEIWEGPNESLENPLVSLECFIFL